MPSQSVVSLGFFGPELADSGVEWSGMKSINNKFQTYYSMAFHSQTDDTDLISWVSPSQQPITEWWWSIETIDFIV